MVHQSFGYNEIYGCCDFYILGNAVIESHGLIDGFNDRCVICELRRYIFRVDFSISRLQEAYIEYLRCLHQSEVCPVCGMASTRICLAYLIGKRHYRHG